MFSYQVGFPFFGVAGCTIIILSILVAVLNYRDQTGASFSFLNRYISELGEVGVSSGARLFNTGLVLAGVSLLPFIIGLGLNLPGMLGWVSILAGLWACVSCILVGVYPMNHEEAHLRAATSYFRAGLATMLTFSLAIYFQPVNSSHVPRYASAFGAVGVLAYAWFLYLLDRRKNDEEQEEESAIDKEGTGNRPRFLLMPALEWFIFMITILWFLSVSLSLL